MSRELLHESLSHPHRQQLVSYRFEERKTNVTESSDLVVRFTLGVEVGSALSSSHVESGEGILEDLLETQEFENGEIDGRVESKSSFV